MPPARQRPLEDSRSETSSTITNVKDRPGLHQTSNSAIPKSRRVIPGPVNAGSTLPRPVVNGTVPAPGELEPNPLGTDWYEFSTRTLHAYRHAYRLNIPSAYTHPHADLIYKSSRVAKRSPSVVFARRKAGELKQDRRKTNNKRKQKMKQLSLSPTVPKPAITTTAALSDLAQSDKTEEHPPAPFRQSAPSLALGLRRHFNSLSLNESEVLTRFLYVVHHCSTTIPRSLAYNLEGSEGDGRGKTMGSQGREVVRNDGAGGGGELGFRLRFRPDVR